MARGFLENAGAFNGQCHCLLNGGLVEVMSANLVDLIKRWIGSVGPFDLRVLARIDSQGCGGKQILPGESTTCLRKFFRQGVREPDPAGTRLEIRNMLRPDDFNLSLQSFDESFGEGYCTILFAFAVPDDDLAAFKIDIFNTQ